MSRIGKLPVSIVKGVSVKEDGKFIFIKGPKGELSYVKHLGLKYELQDSQIVVTRTSNLPKDRALHGLSRALISNIVKGVSEGYVKKLEIVGVGFKAAVQGTFLNLQLGYSHPINFEIPKSVSAKVDGNTKITLESCDKQLLGEVAAKIRSFKKPEPYKGKGVKYADEVIVKKQGKTAGK